VNRREKYSNAVCAALASPLYANQEQKAVEPEPNPVGHVEKSLDQYSALELKTKYESELYTSIKDEELTGPEIEKLHAILDKYLEKKTNGVTLSKPRIASEDDIDSLIYEFEQKILAHYPGLCSEDDSLKYE